jgi:nucleoid-associated protein YgaU
MLAIQWVGLACVVSFGVGLIVPRGAAAPAIQTTGAAIPALDSATARVIQAATVSPTPGDSAKGTHTVVRGETLRILATRYYGDAEQWRRIFAANRRSLTSPDQLTEGKVLTIPGAK